ncbi:MAG: glycosyltransferase family 39 protein [Acidobacteriota bacterium]
MRRSHLVALVLLVGLGVARIASTYTTFVGTYDEPWHVVMGMEPLQYGSYTYEHQHPPLSRLAVALGPYLDGARAPVHRTNVVDNIDEYYADGNAILYSSGGYWRNLTLARIGTLPFFVLLCVITFLWARRWFSEATGWWALILITCCAPILGHAGLATIDVAGAAGMALALYIVLRWIETPSASWSVGLGLAVAFAFMTKLSAVAFLGAAFLIGLPVAYWLLWRKQGIPAIRNFAIVGFALLLALWVCFGFSTKRLIDTWGPSPALDRALRDYPVLTTPVEFVMSMPLPLSEMVTGVRNVYRHDAAGHGSFLLGEYRTSGWWYFFPIVLAVKTPLGMLLLGVAGVASTLWDARVVPWQKLLTALFVLAILAVCMKSRLNLGVRHILAVYPLLAVLGGALAANVIRSRRAITLIPVALVVWTVIDSVRAHPDYLAHFNELVGAHPENILAESDLDWGQDLARLSHRLKDLNVDRIAIAYFGSALLERADLPTYRTLDPKQPTPGFVAISLHHRMMSRARDGSYAWLDKYTPRERIGKSIDLFYIPE